MSPTVPHLPISPALAYKSPISSIKRPAALWHNTPQTSYLDDLISLSPLSPSFPNASLPSPTSSSFVTTNKPTGLSRTKSAADHTPSPRSPKSGWFLEAKTPDENEEMEPPSDSSNRSRNAASGTVRRMVSHTELRKIPSLSLNIPSPTTNNGVDNSDPSSSASSLSSFLSATSAPTTPTTADTPSSENTKGGETPTPNSSDTPHPSSFRAAPHTQERRTALRGVTSLYNLRGAALTAASIPSVPSTAPAKSSPQAKPAHQPTIPNGDAVASKKPLPKMPPALLKRTVSEQRYVPHSNATAAMNQKATQATTPSANSSTPGTSELKKNTKLKVVPAATVTGGGYWQEPGGTWEGQWNLGDLRQVAEILRGLRLEV